MKPAFSVIFLTTLIGAAQGLFLLLVGSQALNLADGDFLVTGGVVCLALAALGLFASFFHLGHPERAWRAAAMWRTSWLSREVIALPVFMGCVVLWSVSLRQNWPGVAVWAVLGSLACGALFVCTAMIYASLRFLQEWASSYTLLNYVLLGCASGTTLGAALATFGQPQLAPPYALLAIGLTVAGAVSRSLSLRRNARLRPRSTLHSAIGIRHPRIVQIATGFLGGSFNTREFFHGQPQAVMTLVRNGFLVLAFVVPLLLLVLSIILPGLLVVAFTVQYLGLLLERWFFFAQSSHPQNLYYQRAA
ncbi:dimethyl sulfoxide reductase anchor subunit [Ideonella sp. 4Y11]|uniref:Dimethyl sulfoxide reductase anchor subunit n=1 Tax=Ideonella aquatica TaxID=2824119 RepID=A0A941BRU2_9BURK|nr:DmsC/YnfH family molybdoenzyme membrane anchor subunit [Ideonella aquatica]MBQ0960840.1 dimethyl sulfoxide reductase anchor subunit [Ideonella aquatica]